MNKVLTTRQVADILNVHIQTVYHYIYGNLLPAYKLGGNGESKRHWKVKAKDLESFMQGARAEHAEASKKNSSQGWSLL